ncbi:hypothetical protein [Bacillus badius]|uniref:Uncharacterized protein n=1 Tax=Bacillus badius TaxID=1455 RepID=A0ABR5ARK3_BACBA|nr:hypothetical protein [Bacillus badius]KIL77389.1 hypothetical protein SD77_1375 [Bacillus badius]KZN98179.1 hypothetical protein A4244_10485 [Bacillus badius]KZR58464.1 hypothetical protein A3781_16335 [Bacillus badius]MED0666717.1 hypothetical protein [Bacillus badius]MED4717267.1 hypothetical protein [Bacillus badius]
MKKKEGNYEKTTYGSAVSVGIEYIQRKWLKQNNWLYILLHGMFGLVNGVWFASWLMALHGMAAALLYAFMDRWLYKRMAEKKGIKGFVLVPLLLCVISWGVMFFTSPSSPPFTKEEAVKFAMSGNGTVTDAFPKKAGKWQGTVNGYEVQRETSVQKEGQEIYLVIFTEKWRKGQETGSWLLSYQVDKGSCTAYAEEGERPPYYK